MTEPRDEFDSPWKDILEAYFEDFIRFFFPHYESRWSELEASRNPFAIAVIAHLQTKETRQDAQTLKE